METGYFKTPPASSKHRDSTSQKGYFALYNKDVFALSAACLLSCAVSEPVTYRIGDLEFKSRINFKKQADSDGDFEGLEGVVEDKWGDKFTYWIVRRTSIRKPLSTQANDGYKNHVGDLFGGVKGVAFCKVDQLMAGKTPVIFSAGSLNMEGRLEPTIMVDLDHQGSRYSLMLFLHDVRRAEAEALTLVRSLTLITKSGREPLRGKVSLEGEYFMSFSPLNARLPMPMSSHPSNYQRRASSLPGSYYIESDKYTVNFYYHRGYEPLPDLFQQLKFTSEFLGLDPVSDLIPKQVGPMMQVWQGTDSQGFPARFEMESHLSGGSEPRLYTALLLIKGKKKGTLPSRDEIGLIDSRK